MNLFIRLVDILLYRAIPCGGLAYAVAVALMQNGFSDGMAGGIGASVGIMLGSAIDNGKLKKN